MIYRMYVCRWCGEEFLVEVVRENPFCPICAKQVANKSFVFAIKRVRE